MCLLSIGLARSFVVLNVLSNGHVMTTRKSVSGPACSSLKLTTSLHLSVNSIDEKQASPVRTSYCPEIMSGSDTKNIADETWCPDTGAIVVTLGVAALLDMATAEALSLMDHAPSLGVVIFRLIDSYASPVALASTLIAWIFWIWRSQTHFKFFFKMTMGLSLLALVDNLVGLIICLFDKQDSPGFLLLSASFVYLENIAVFTAFYWYFDHPLQIRIAAGEKIRSEILFPQHGLPFESLANCKPSYMDYLFLTFNTSSTFGPTHPIPLGGTVQVGMMLQVSVAMVILIVLAARAIGLIH